ncbi:hypothetical protein J23TS9_38820 [Paenibacillus sp. J23TS9]|nr:hypothetical protein J23TS9_38820 [Paenibacillus sp. J23TS9]
MPQIKPLVSWAGQRGEGRLPDFSAAHLKISSKKGLEAKLPALSYILQGRISSSVPGKEDIDPSDPSPWQQPW